MTKRSRLSFLLVPALAACGSSVPPNNGHNALNSSTAPRVCSSNTLTGIDVSHYQPNMNWGAVAGAGASFAFAKATEGTGTTDATFATNWSGMQQAGLVRGAYHFFHASEDGTQQADFFLSVVGQLQPTDLVPMLDIEIMDNQSATTVVQQVGAFLNEINAKTGLNAIIYTSPGFWPQIGSPTQWSGNPLWIANYGYSCPAIPTPWTGWQFWQSSGSGSFSGCNSQVDLDEFNGSASDLQGMTVGMGSGGGCAATNAACASGQACCTSGDTCTNSVCCVVDGSPADNGDSTTCCSNNGVDGNGNCQPAAPSCVSPGSACVLFTDCCNSGDACNNSVCCAPDGAQPDNGDSTTCCSGFGLDDNGNCASCVAGSCCSAPGGTCAQDSDCCNSSDTCNGNSNVCCSPDGSPPDNDDPSTCCNGMLDGNGNCSSCTAPGGSCGQDSDCCNSTDSCDPINAVCCAPQGAAPDNGDSSTCCDGAGTDQNGNCN